VLLPYLQGAQIWVKYINANNGLNGHQVRFLVYDDTADPARHRAQVQEAIEQKGAIAFLMNAETITGGGSVEYLKAKRVPVIGGTGGEDWATTSPMYFPQMTTGQANVRMLLPSIAPLTAAKGKSKLATLVCVEAPPCDPWDKALAETAGPAGFQHVYRARASLSQPDYTAECLAARNAGAQIVYMLFDGTAMNRVAAACARQGYRPTFATFGPGLTDDQRKDPLLDGTLGTSNTAPFFQSGTPATAEFQAAARSFGPNIPLSIPTGYGWVAGKVLQKAGANLSEPPTSESLLAGLWSIKNDTLGSLTEPLTFVPDQPPKQTMCWYLVAFKDTKWISPDDFKQTCL
jgi:ABC-type branched-subunit amino acid transport system substrate-binding protein